MKPKALLILLVLGAFIGGLVWSVSQRQGVFTSGSAIDPDLLIPSPAPETPLPTPVPTLALKLDLEVTPAKTDLKIIPVSPSPTASPALPKILEDLSRVDITVDEKRRPMLHYSFSGKPERAGSNTSDELQPPPN